MRLRAAIRSAAPRSGSLLLTGTALASYYGHDYWTVGRFLVSTDDAYVKADSTTVAPKVAGYLAEVLVSDNQPVRSRAGAGADRRPRLARRPRRGPCRRCGRGRDGCQPDARISLQGAEIAQAQAAVDATAARLAFARADAERYRSLATTGAGTVQRAEQTVSARDAAVAQLVTIRPPCSPPSGRSPVLVTLREQAEAQAARSRAAAASGGAEPELCDDHRRGRWHNRRPLATRRPIRARRHPTDGGRAAASGLCRRQLQGNPAAHVRVGQKVTLLVDGLPGTTLAGKVDSIVAGQRARIRAAAAG